MSYRPLKNLDGYTIILASKSPRRQALLKGLGIDFETRTKEVEEVYPDHLKGKEIAEFLAELKAKGFGELKEKELLITSDTIVCLGEEILGKPKDKTDAIRMLTMLSGKAHQVVTAVCLQSTSFKKTFSVITNVHFDVLSNEQIQYYVDNFQPLDKAGSYGVQEWIGYIGIKKLEGCYYNVMGLPLNALYAELKRLQLLNTNGG